MKRLLACLLAAAFLSSLRAQQPPAAPSSPLTSQPQDASSREEASPQALFRGGGSGGARMTPEVRERLAQLLQLPKDKLWDELVKWPAFREMSLQEQAGFLNRLAEMRQRIRLQALKKAAELGLKLSPEQEDAFVNSYLRERMEIEKKIWQETQAKRRELDEQLKSNLKKQYAGEPKPAPAPAH